MKNRNLIRIAPTLMAALFALLVLSGCTSKKVPPIKENEFYVCSMDPQVKEKEPGLCPICKMELTKTTIDTKDSRFVKLNNDQRKLANIKVEEIATSAFGNSKTINGVFAVNQNKTEQVSALITGRVDRLYHQIEGTKINKGDKLYDLYSRELLQAQEEYLLAIEKSKLLKTAGPGFVAAARNKLLLWGLSNDKIKVLEQNGQPKITNTIYSKVSGVITKIELKEGDYVNEGGGIYKIADLSTLWVEAQIYAADAALFREGQEVVVTPESYPDERLKGKVIFSNPELQQNSNINLVRIEVSNEQMQYRPGMQVSVSNISTDREALTIPSDAVIRNATNSIVWVEIANNTFEPRMVMTGKQSAGQVEITSGIEPGDSVVVSGAYLLNSEFVFKKGMNPMGNMDHQKAKM